MGDPFIFLGDIDHADVLDPEPVIVGFWLALGLSRGGGTIAEALDCYEEASVAELGERSEIIPL